MGDEYEAPHSDEECYSDYSGSDSSSSAEEDLPHVTTTTASSIAVPGPDPAKWFDSLQTSLLSGGPVFPPPPTTNKPPTPPPPTAEAEEVPAKSPKR